MSSRACITPEATPSGPTGRTSPSPRCRSGCFVPPDSFLVARDFHGRTGSAFEFLVENKLPVRLIRVSLYEDAQKRRFVDVEGEHQPDITPAGTTGGSTAVPITIDGHRVRLTDLLEAGHPSPVTPLVWERRRLGQTYRASFTDNGSIQLDDGRSFSSLPVPPRRPLGLPRTAAGLRGESTLPTGGSSKTSVRIS